MIATDVDKIYIVKNLVGFGTIVHGFVRNDVLHTAKRTFIDSVTVCGFFPSIGIKPESANITNT